MTDKIESPSAQRVALARYSHILFDGDPKIHEDHLSVKLVDPDFPDDIEIYRPNPDVPKRLQDMRIFLPYRARTVEDNLRAAYQTGVRQYLIMGAGLDTYAFRQDPEMMDLQIFEIDHPASQRFKKKRIEANNWDMPPNLIFTECDFETTSVTDALMEAGFDPSQPSFIAWAGVIMYLDAASGAEALKEMSAFSAPGSVLIFDYQKHPDLLDAEDNDVLDFITALATEAGEPFKTFHKPAQIEAMCQDAGFAKVALDGFDEPARSLATNREDGAELPNLAALVKAEK